jgi:hypothetical protein
VHRARGSANHSTASLELLLVHADAHPVFAIRFPDQDQADVSALLKGVEMEIVDLQAFVAVPSDATWTTYQTDGTTFSGDANALRNDLGLLPVPTT